MENKERVLLLAPSFMDLYKDIIEGLKKKNYRVDWVEDDQIPGNPIRKLDRNNKSIDDYNQKVEEFWENYFSSSETFYYDYFLAIGGLMVHEVLFNILNKRNINVKKYLYLFDRIDGVYDVSAYLPFYSRVFSFDIYDCRRYNLKHLPIYWVQADNTTIVKYDIFGFASYSCFKPERTKIFRDIKKLSDSLKLKSYIKLFQSDYGNRFTYCLKRILKELIGREGEMPNLNDDLITTKSISPDKFREYIAMSNIILDTQASYQDGLTARFMWALGANKRIITTNKAVADYSFYNKDFIFILDDNYEDLANFIITDVVVDYDTSVINYRIDNWLDTIFH